LNTNVSRRFIFNQTDVRGEIVHLDTSLQELFRNHDYPAPVRDLLSQALVAVVLLGSIIKFKGRLVLQARSEGPITLLMAEVTDQQHIRGYAQFNETLKAMSGTVQDMLGNGTLAITIEPLKGESYQSLVPIKEGTLGECLEHYFQQSEQLNTLIRLVADKESASGMLVQQLPPQLIRDPILRNENWTRLLLLGDSVSSHELLSLDSVEVLQRLYHQEDVKLLEKKAITFVCTCSDARMASALKSLGSDELDSLFEETPIVKMNCEICATARSFTRQRLTELMGWSE
jgi:molecular chaperone Hsp33